MTVLADATEKQNLEAKPSTDQRVPVLIVVAVMMTAVLEVLDTTIVNVALPYMKAAFGATTDQATWIPTSYIIAALVMMPLTGFLSRRFGRKRLILTAIIGFSVSSALCGISWSLGSMVFFRVSQGVFGAFLIPLAQSILFDSFPKEKRGQAMAMFGLGVVVAPVVGPTIGALMTEYYSWRMIFFINLPFAITALLLMTGELPSDEPKDIRIDWTGLILMALAAGTLQFVLDQGETLSWLSSHAIQVAIAVCALSSLFFIARGIGYRANIIDFSLFSDRNFAFGCLVIAGFSAAMFGSVAILPLFVQDLLGYPVIDAGLLFIPRGLMAGFMMVLAGRVLVHRFDARILVAIGLVMTASGNFMTGSLNLNASFWQLAWPGVVQAVGMGLVFVPMTTLAFDRISQDRQDEASGLYNVFRQLGSSVGIALIGVFVVRGVALDTTVLRSHITLYNPEVYTYLSPLGVSPESLKGAAILGVETTRQATMLSFARVFDMLGYLALAMIPLLLLTKKPIHAQTGSENS